MSTTVARWSLIDSRPLSPRRRAGPAGGGSEGESGPMRLSSRIAALCCGLLMASVAVGAERPNIVWLVSEDNSACWLRLYDRDGAPMPNIERLADSVVYE